MEELTLFQRLVIQAEYEIVADAIKKANFRKGKAAKNLGVDIKTIHNKLSRYAEVFMREEESAA